MPQYNPTVVVAGPAPYWGYYPTPYPSYYYPYPPGAALATGVIWGAAIGAAWSGNRYGCCGDTNINVNRNTNINTGNINRGARSGQAAAPRGSPTSSRVRSAVRSARPRRRRGRAMRARAAPARPAAAQSGIGAGRAAVRDGASRATRKWWSWQSRWWRRW